MQMKTCTRCHRSKPVGDFYRGVRTCKPCYIAQAKAARIKRAALEAARPEPKTCTRCDQVKDLEEFYTSYGASYPHCKACHRVILRAYYAANRERINARRAAAIRNRKGRA